MSVNADPDPEPRNVKLTLTPDEALALWYWINQCYPEDRDVWGCATGKFEDAMTIAGVDDEAIMAPWRRWTHGA